MYINATTLVLLTIFLILCMASLMIAWGVYYYQIKKPMGNIREQASKIASKNTANGHTIPEPQNKDLGAIVQSFNQLSLKLQQTTEEMEMRINERTHLLEEGTRLVQEVLDTTPSLLCLINLEMDAFNYVNHEFSEFFGVNNEEMVKLGPAFMRGRVFPADQEIFSGHSRQLLAVQNGGIVQSELRLIDFQGKARWISFRSLVFQRNTEGEPKLALYVGQDITDFKETEEQLRYVSIHDQLTQLYNRLYFDEELIRLERGRNYPVSAIMADLDDLKLVNDTYGHAAGDQLLIQAAKLFRSCFRSADVVARIGGDEFAALLPGTDVESALRVMERIRYKFLKSTSAINSLPIGISIGQSTAEKGDSLLESIKSADKTMYQNKLERKNHHKE